MTAQSARSSGRKTAQARGSAGGRLVIVSNRVADPSRDRKAGGLAVAVSEALSASGGFWFGWSGKVSDTAETARPLLRHRGGIDLMTLDLTPQEHRGYYQGFANQSLWPLFHFRSDLVHYDGSEQNEYRRVNQRFAEALAPVLQAEDVVWVQDFHLLPLGAELRRRGCRQPLGIFLHVPFPPTEVVATLPGHRDLLGTLLAYDLVGFQTANDAACFRAYAERELGAKQRPGGALFFGGRTVGVGTFAVGIDTEGFAALSQSEEAHRQIASLRASLGARQLIVGVDRLDYSKGLPQRFEAYRRFLDRCPESRNRVVFTQVAPPSREQLEAYVEIRQELDRLEGAIQGQFADFDWTPMRYIRRPVAREKLAALYRASRVGLVTPLRDGMNLVAKEFVAAQDIEDPGVLVLSCFAGAAETMRQAVIVNPYDVDQMADAIKDALRMPSAERRARHAELLSTIRRQDVRAWHRHFLAMLKTAATGANALESMFQATAGQGKPPAAVRAQTASAGMDLHRGLGATVAGS